jgi:hypothetical protein
VEDWEVGEHFVAAIIRNRCDNWRWRMVTVYGQADHASSGAFVEELGGYFRTSVLPTIIGGDFNLIRFEEDKRNCVGDKKIMNAFNSFIEELDLRELHKGGAGSHGLIIKFLRS